MSVDHLRTEQNSGEIGLFALFTNRFSNFRVTHKDAIQKNQKKDSDPIDKVIISEWNITQSKPYKEGALNFKDFSKETYTTVTTEKSGLLPFSKHIQKSSSGNFGQNKQDYVVAMTTVNANKDETRLFSFDYSDKIIVYLNGQVVFKGNNAFRAKGVQYMGHLSISTNTLYLPLKKGKNTLHCVVIDQANGWGLMGKLE